MRSLKISLFLFLLISCLMVTFSVNGETPSPLLGGEVLYYTFDTESINGLVLTDDSPNSLNGYLDNVGEGPYPYLEDGLFSECLRFPSDSQIWIPQDNELIFTDSDFSVTVWLKLYNVSDTGYNAFYLFGAGDWEHLTGWQIWLNDGGSSYYPYFTTFQSGTAQHSNTDALSSNSQWVFVSLVRNGSEGSIRINLNAQSLNNATHIDPAFRDLPYVIGYCSSDLDFSLDDFRLFNRALTVEELQTLYESGYPPEPTPTPTATPTVAPTPTPVVTVSPTATPATPTPTPYIIIYPQPETSILSALGIVSLIMLGINVLFLFFKTRVGVLFGIVSLILFAYTLADSTLPAQPVFSLICIIVAFVQAGQSLTFKVKK